jgi:hypothetical protein
MEYENACPHYYLLTQTKLNSTQKPNHVLPAKEYISLKTVVMPPSGIACLDYKDPDTRQREAGGNPMLGDWQFSLLTALFLTQGRR